MSGSVGSRHVARSKTITAWKEDKTFEEAIPAAFSAVEIELQKYRDKRRGTEVRICPVLPLRSMISKVFSEDGYGFILQDGGDELYFVVFNAAPGNKAELATVVLAPFGNCRSRVSRPLVSNKYNSGSVPTP
ncbi:MAG TPA: HPF/RaiA family ribosome-associated protein [Nitrospiraceae bacterium]|nr:HPF/RaiA family ribosome-associated protein [Nitrospiraceae bacterium]